MMKMTKKEMQARYEVLQAKWEEMHDQRRALGVQMDRVAKQLDELEAQL